MLKNNCRNCNFFNPFDAMPGGRCTLAPNKMIQNPFNQACKAYKPDKDMAKFYSIPDYSEVAPIETPWATSENFTQALNEKVLKTGVATKEAAEALKKLFQVAPTVIPLDPKPAQESKSTPETEPEEEYTPGKRKLIL